MMSVYDKAVCRVMIYSYKELEDRCEAVDKAIYNTAIHSAFKNTIETYKDIERLTREKIAYINVKVIIDQAIATLKRKYELEQHHIKGITIEQIAITLNIKSHTIQRRVELQREKLYEAILNTHSGEKLLDVICDSQWLMNRYRKAINSVKKSDNIKAKEINE